MAKASIAKKFTVSAASAAVLGVMSLGAQANETDIDFGGFVKLDMMVSDYTDGQAPSSGSIARQQYIPSLTPVGGEGDDMVTDFHARQSRFFPYHRH